MAEYPEQLMRLALINPMILSLSIFSKMRLPTAIYGSRASNGVIIITTKKEEAGKMRFNFSTQYSLSTLPKEADVLTPASVQAYVNSHGTPAQIALMGNASTDCRMRFIIMPALLIII